MNGIGILDWLVAIGSISTPIVVIIAGTIIWKYQQSIERKIKLEEQLHDDRIEIYNQLLEPFIILFMSDEAWLTDPKHKNKDKSKFAISKMLTLEYRITSSRLSLIGSDPVVSSYNNLMQHAFSLTDNPSSINDPSEMISLLGNLLLEIRRSMGNEDTKLDNWAMLEWFITDARKYRDNNQSA